MDSHSEKKEQSTIAQKILVNVSEVLSRTKDALLKDLKDNIEQYFPDKANLDNYTFDEFLKDIREDGKSPLTTFVEGFFNKLGYDISHFEESEELCSLVTSVVFVSLKLADGVKDLCSETDSVLLKYKDAYEKSIGNGQATAADYKEAAESIFSDKSYNAAFNKKTQHGEVYGSISLAGQTGDIAGKASAVFDIIKELVDLIQSFKKIELDRISGEMTEFGIFLKDKFVSKEFAERIMDHVLTVLFKNAKEIFADDIEALTKKLENISNEVKEALEEKAKEAGKDFNAIKKRIEELHKRIEKAAKQLAEDASDAAEAEYRIAKEELQRLMDSAFDDFEGVGKVFSRIHAVLSFLKLVEKRTIDVARYIPSSVKDLPAISNVKLGDGISIDLGKTENLNALLAAMGEPSAESLVDGAVQLAVDSAGNLVNSHIDKANSTITAINVKAEDILASIKRAVPTVEIYVINWDQLSHLLSNPLEYLQQKYPISSLKDAEDLLEAISLVAKAFGADIPDIDSIQKLLWDIFIRVKDRLEDEFTPLANDVRQKFEQCKAFILDLIRTIQHLASVVKDELTREYNEAAKAIKSAKKEIQQEAGETINSVVLLLKSIQEELNCAFESANKEIESEANKAVKELKNFKVPGSSIKFQLAGTEEEVKKILSDALLDPFIQIVAEKAKNLDIDGVEADAWKNALLATTVGPKASLYKGKDIISKYFDAVKEIRDAIAAQAKELTSEKAWEQKFGMLVEALQKEFEKQTANVPTSEEAIKKYAIANVEKCLSGGTLNNPFADFDVIAYFNIMSEQLKAMIPDLSDAYMLKFREATVEAITALVSLDFSGDTSGIKAQLDKAKAMPKKIEQMAEEVFTEYWSTLKKNIKEKLLDPFYALIGQAVKQWVTNVLLPKAIRMIQEKIMKELNLSAYKQLLIEAGQEINEIGQEIQDAGEKAKKVATAISDFTPDSIKDAADIIADELDKLLPSDVKKKLDETRKALGLTGDALQMVIDLLMLTQEAKDVNTWSDGLKFAIKLYRIIPASIKKEITGLIDLPKIDFSDFELPSYTLNIEKKFLAVTIYESKHNPKAAEKTDSKNQQDFNISIQLVGLVGERIRNAEEEEIVPGLYVFPMVKIGYDAKFAIGEAHVLAIDASGSVNENVSTKVLADSEKDKEKGSKDAKEKAVDAEASKDISEGMLGFFFSQRHTLKEVGNSAMSVASLKMLIPDVEMLFATEAFKASIELLFRRGQVKDGKYEPLKEPLYIVQSDLIEFSIEDYPQKLFLTYDGSFDAGYLGRLENTKFILKLREGSDLLSLILKDDVEASLETFHLGYSIKKGLTFGGKPKLVFPIKDDIEIHGSKIKNLKIEIGTEDFKSICFSLGLDLTVDFSVVKFSFGETGFGFDLQLVGSDGRFGDFDFSPSLQLPSGIGISIDTSGIKGTGIVKWDIGRHEYFGALSLEVINKFSVEGLLLLNTKLPDGSRGIALVAALSFEFTPAIQLGMGFALKGVGGSLGVNRAIDNDKLITAVHDGSLMACVMAKDLDKNLDTVLANIADYYPVEKGAFFFGIMATLSWGEIFKIDAGLFIEVSNSSSVIIVGGLHLDIASSLDKLLSINVMFMAQVEFAKGFMLDAALVDSYIVGLELYGDVVMRILWGGDTKGFLLSAGGFHPSYTPEPGFKVPAMRRLGMKLNCEMLVFKLESYIAVTSNTVQFGALVVLDVDWKVCRLNGGMEFNALFQFKPFRFAFDASAYLNVYVGGLRMLGIYLSFAMEGPAKWKCKGNASFYLLFIKVSVGFSVSWGKSQEASLYAYTEIVHLLEDAYNNNDNWTIITSDLSDNLVAIEKQTSEMAIGESDEEMKEIIIIHPSETLIFKQEIVPLEEEIDKFGETLPGDMSKISLDSVRISGEDVAVDTVTSSFAPSMFKKMSNDEKLSAKSYEDKPSGFNTCRVGGEQNGGKLADTLNTEYKQDADPLEVWKQKCKIMAATPTQAKDDKKSAAKAKAASINPMNGADGMRYSRPSSRRTDEGFKRYVKELDNAMNNKK